MKIAIDLNDVIRAYTRQFANLYRQNVDRTVSMDQEIYTNDLRLIFPFQTDADYNRFVYENYAFNLFGSSPTCEKRLPEALNNWLAGIIPNIDTEEPIEVMFVSTYEFGLSIPSTYFFLSKLGSKVRETYFPIDSLTIWDKCDILITANPALLSAKPEGKVTIKIDTDYNKDNEADYSYTSATAFFKDENNTEKIINEYGRN